MAKMTKSQILQTLAEKAEVTKKQATALVDAMTAMAYSEVKKSGEFTIPGIGKLVKKRREARQGRNPATGQTISIPAKTVVKFRVSKVAKDAIL
jgi:DNA-binding protein HU-beta